MSVSEYKTRVEKSNFDLDAQRVENTFLTFSVNISSANLLLRPNLSLLILQFTIRRIKNECNSAIYGTLAPFNGFINQLFSHVKEWQMFRWMGSFPNIWDVFLNHESIIMVIGCVIDF